VLKKKEKKKKEKKEERKRKRKRKRKSLLLQTVLSTQPHDGTGVIILNPWHMRRLLEVPHKAATAAAVHPLEVHPEGAHGTHDICSVPPSTSRGDVP